MNLKNYIRELKRRNVIKASLAYLIVAWLLVQIASIILPTFNAPEYLLKTLVFFLILGFPANLIFSWVYEITPEGLQKTGNIDNNNSSSNIKNNKLNKIIIGTLVLVIILLVFKQFSSENNSVVENITKKQIIDNNDILNKSIAVLPFDDMSRNGDQEWFSDGMMEEILNHLFKIGELQVTSRTSSMNYKNSDKSLKNIGKELGVAYLLEGSVRKDGERLRITVQLIDVETDLHLWSENYDRDLKDVFAVQSEVAKKIANYLKAEISPEIEKIIEIAPTNSTEAYSIYLRARSLSMFNKEENSEAIRFLNEAIKLDANFSFAYLSIGMRLTAANLLATGEGMNATETWLISKPYIQKAIDLDKNNAFAHARMAESLLWFEWDLEGAEKEYTKVKKITPSYNWVDFLILTGQTEEALKGASKGIELNPQSFEGWTGLILSQYFANRHEEVIETIDMALNTSLNDGRLIFIYSEASRVLMFLEMFDEALVKINKLKKLYPKIETPRLMAIECISYYHINELEKSTQIEKKLIEKSKINSGGSPYFHLTMINSQKGEIDKAFEYLQKAFEVHEVEMYWLKIEPPFEPLHHDPRWNKMLNKVGIP